MFIGSASDQNCCQIHAHETTNDGSIDNGFLFATHVCVCVVLHALCSVVFSFPIHNKFIFTLAQWPNDGKIAYTPFGCALSICFCLILHASYFRRLHCFTQSAAAAAAAATAAVPSFQSKDIYEIFVSIAIRSFPVEFKLFVQVESSLNPFTCSFIFFYDYGDCYCV